MRYKLVLLLMILASILAACGGGGDADPTETTTQTDGSSVELSETFSGATSASGTLTVNYPSGWTQSGTADGLSLTNTDAVISITVMPAALTATMGSTPSEILASFASNVASAAGITYSEPEDVTFGSNSGALVSATGNDINYVIAIVDVNESYVFLSLTGPEADMAANRATLEAIAASVSLSS